MLLAEIQGLKATPHWNEVHVHVSHTIQTKGHHWVKTGS